MNINELIVIKYEQYTNKTIYRTIFLYYQNHDEKLRNQIAKHETNIKMYNAIQLFTSFLITNPTFCSFTFRDSLLFYWPLNTFARIKIFYGI